MDSQKVHNLFLQLCEIAYKEGREHQKEDDFPDIGMHFTKSFKDTEVYRTLMENKPK